MKGEKDTTNTDSTTVPSLNRLANEKVPRDAGLLGLKQWFRSKYTK